MLRLHPSCIILAPNEVTRALSTPCPSRPQDTHAWDHITVRRARRKSKPTADTGTNLAVSFSSLQISAAAAAAASPSSAGDSNTTEQDEDEEEEEEDSREGEVLFPGSHSMLTVMDGALSSLDNLTSTTTPEEFDTSNWVVYEDDISEGGEQEEEMDPEYEADSESEQQQQQPLPLQTLTPRQLDGAGEAETTDIIIAEENDDDDGGFHYYDLGLLPNNTRILRPGGRRVSGTRIEVLRDVDIVRHEDEVGRRVVNVVEEAYDEEDEGAAVFPPETIQALEYRKRRRQNEAAKRIIR
jgi:hypothetical protein